MNLFGENLQYYRKKQNMTQEQLAELMGVSRQTVSKWEAGISYAEMDKVLQLCDLFSCNMDTLLRGEAGKEEVRDNEMHREYMRAFRKGVTTGVVLLILSCAVRELLVGAGIREEIGDACFWVLIIVAILIFIVKGMQNEHYKGKYPVIQDFYTEEEKDAFAQKCPVRIAAGVGILLIGLFVFGSLGDTLPLGEGMTEDFYYGLFMLCAAAGVGTLVYNGMRKEEYDVEKYNRENNPQLKKENEKKSEKTGVWCGCIMLTATIIFFITGFIFGLWKVNWVAFPVGGLLCGMVSIIFNREKRE